jgi:hydrogenase assembly chaperone HypC/HupF
MCLGIPGEVVELVEGTEGQVAIVDVEGARRPVNVGMLDDVGLVPGDWVLIHVGFAVEKVSKDKADEALAGLQLLGQDMT